MPYKNQFRRLMGAYLKGKQDLSPLTLRTERYWLVSAEREFNGMNPNEIKLENLFEYEARMRTGATNAANKCFALRRFLIWTGNPAVKKWKIRVRPTRKVNGTFLREDQVAYLRKCVQAKGALEELLYSLGVDNGLRAVDMERLTTQNAQDMLQSGVSVVLGKGRQGGKKRVLAMSEMTFQCLSGYLLWRKQQLEEHPLRTDRLLIARHTQTGRSYELTAGGIYGKLKPIFKASGFPHLTVHDLRRTFGNRHWRIGTPLEIIAEMMGHESVNQTFKAYIGVQLLDMVSAQQKLSKSNPCPPIQYP